jgi:hypothetical protein
MSIGLTPAFRAGDLSLELLDPGAFALVRLFKAERAGGPGGEWEPPASQCRKLRVDPPAGHEAEFAVLYTADTLACVAAECRVLVPRPNGTFGVRRDLLEIYRVARYRFAAPALFIRLDGAVADPLGLQPRVLGPGVDLSNPYARYQAVSLELYRRLGAVAHGLSWQSMHRNQLGRIYAIWHDRKTSCELTLDAVLAQTPLAQDAEWLEFEAHNPGLTAVPSPGSD